MCIRYFIVFKPTFYLQCHLEYNKPTTKFPTILDSFLLRVTVAPLHHAGLTLGGGRGGGRARVYFKQNGLGRSRGNISLVIGH